MSVMSSTTVLNWPTSKGKWSLDRMICTTGFLLAWRNANS
jgi:hypothetical protein